MPRRRAKNWKKLPFCITNVPTCLLVGFHVELHFKMWVVKVEVLWEAHKFFEKSPLYICNCLVNVKTTVEISQNFVAFSEYLNFNKNRIHLPGIPGIFLCFVNVFISSTFSYIFGIHIKYSKYPKIVKLRYSEKANRPIVLTLMSNKWEIFSNYLSSYEKYIILTIDNQKLNKFKIRF